MGAAEASARFTELAKKLSGYLSSHVLDRIHAAYRFGEERHRGQRRETGEPYIDHPLEVGCILADMRMDCSTIVAAILHDVIEDTDTAKQEIRLRFGLEVTELVDGVTKLSRIKSGSFRRSQAENMHKMFLAISKDIRVILIKLADRLHNMRTLSVLPRAKQQRIAQETLDIYAPIAHRLGMNAVRMELENLALRGLYPTRHAVLTKYLRRRGDRRALIVGKAGRALEQRFRQEGVEARVLGREKHLYGVYKKMRDRRLRLNEIGDVHALRIITSSVRDCYLALGVIHSLYKPVPGKFTDYIAIPKANGYQSLHTVLSDHNGQFIEVQIRSEEMDHMAEEGIAAHWRYKTGGSDARGAHRKMRNWLRDVLELQRIASNPEEFLEHVRIDLFPDEVYVFTPKGDILKLPEGATALDMAYAVHTDVGSQCLEVRIDGQPAPLGTRLESGQSVEVITSPLAEPQPEWLSCVVTAKARLKIRQSLAHVQINSAQELGHRILRAELKALKQSYDVLPEEQLEKILKRHRLESTEQLLEQIGMGNIPASLVARELVVDTGDEGLGAESQELALVITGEEQRALKYGKCCHPVPGDNVIGHLSYGRGIVIHRDSCQNAVAAHRHPDQWFRAAWDPSIEDQFIAGLRLGVINRQGVLAIVSSAISECNSNITDLAIGGGWDRHSELRFELEVRDRAHLARIIRRLRGIPEVGAIHRT